MVLKIVSVAALGSDLFIRSEVDGIPRQTQFPMAWCDRLGDTQCVLFMLDQIRSGLPAPVYPLLTAGQMFNLMKDIKIL